MALDSLYSEEFPEKFADAGQVIATHRRIILIF